jgi:hypothetical protein
LSRKSSPATTSAAVDSNPNGVEDLRQCWEAGSQASCRLIAEHMHPDLLVTGHLRFEAPRHFV